MLLPLCHPAPHWASRGVDGAGEAGSLSIRRHSDQSGVEADPAQGARCHQQPCADDSGRPHCRWHPHAAAEARHPRRPVPAAPASCPGAAMWGSPAGAFLDCWARGKSHSLQAGSGQSCPGTTPGDEAGASLQDRREGRRDGVSPVFCFWIPTGDSRPNPFPSAFLPQPPL